MAKRYLLGNDVGSSSVKAALYDAQNDQVIKTVQSPQKEMNILSLQPGWAEQQPEDWWNHVCTATKLLILKTSINPSDIAAIGIAN